jgi:hypothetical protein
LKKHRKYRLRRRRNGLRHARLLLELCAGNRYTAFTICTVASLGDFPSSTPNDAIRALYGIDAVGTDLTPHWRNVYTLYCRMAPSVNPSLIPNRADNTTGIGGITNAYAYYVEGLRARDVQ